MTGITGIFQGLLTGFPLSGMLGYITLLFLTAFPLSGITGLNLIAVGLPMTAFLKFASVALSVILMTFIMPYFPYFMQGPWLVWLAGLGPWYMFDILQMLDFGEFQNTGFRSMIPVELIPSGGGKDSSWRLTSTFLNLFLATIAASGIVLSSAFPEISIFGVSGKAFGDVTAITGGSLLGVSALGSLAAVAFGPSVAPPSVLAELQVAKGGGTGLPPLSEFIGQLSKEQAGGGAASKSDQTFLSLLAFVGLGGLFLGLARSKT